MNVTASVTASIDMRNDILIPFDTSHYKDYQGQESIENYPYSLPADMQDEYNKEEWTSYKSDEIPDPWDIPEAEAKEDPYDHDSDVPKYPDVTEDPEIPKSEDNEYNWPTNGMAGPVAKEYWNPKMTRLEDNEPSSTLHNQMTLEEVHEWLQEPSDQVVFDRYDWPNQEDNKKWQRLCRLELQRNYWTGDLGPDF